MYKRQGKTCAFGIPLILGLEQDKVYPQAVVLAPTRELAQQITEDLKDLYLIHISSSTKPLPAGPVRRSASPAASFASCAVPRPFT